MKQCLKVRKSFDAIILNQLPADELKKIQSHLGKCKNCSEELSEYRRLAANLRRYKREEATPEFMNSLWTKIEPQLQKNLPLRQHISERIKEFFNFDYTWIRYSVAFLLLAGGILIGKYMFNASDREVTGLTKDEIQRAIVQAKAQRFLGKSKVLLLGILNHDIDASAGLSRQRQLSSDLIKETAALKEELKNSKELLLGALIEDLEIILLQIAHLESTHDLESVEMIQSGIRREGVLFKINLEEIKRSRHFDSRTKQNSSRSM